MTSLDFNKAKEDVARDDSPTNLARRLQRAAGHFTKVVEQSKAGRTEARANATVAVHERVIPPWVLAAAIVIPPAGAKDEPRVAAQ